MWTVEWSGGWNTEFQGNRILQSSADLIAVLATRDSQGDAEFTLGQQDPAYPCLVLSVHADRWYVHYFPDEGDPGAFVVGDDPTAKGTLCFSAGSNIEVHRANLVDRVVAEQVAVEFLASGRRPASVEWFEL